MWWFERFLKLLGLSDISPSRFHVSFRGSAKHCMIVHNAFAQPRDILVPPDGWSHSCSGRKRFSSKPCPAPLVATSQVTNAMAAAKNRTSLLSWRSRVMSPPDCRAAAITWKVLRRQMVPSRYFDTSTSKNQSEKPGAPFFRWGMFQTWATSQETDHIWMVNMTRCLKIIEK